MALGRLWGVGIILLMHRLTRIFQRCAFTVLLCSGVVVDTFAIDELSDRSRFVSMPVPRVIILADMGHDPDEEQQIAHLLACSNEFELEGLIAVTGRFFRKNPTERVKDLRPHLFHQLIDGYEEVYPNLKIHDEGWKKPDYLRSIVAKGQEDNGIADTGVGHSSAGSNLIIFAVAKPDPRPVHIIINAGANTLAQALVDYRANHTVSEMEAFVSKLRVYENSGQDDAGAWICHEFPSIHWVRSVEQSRDYGGPSNKLIGPHVWKPYPHSPEGQHEWARENVQTNHGSLGSLYPDRTVGSVTHYIEGGGTVPWLTFAAPGLSDPSEPSWGGWSGRYSIEKQWNVSSNFAIIHPDERKFEPYAAYTDRDGIVDQWLDPIDGKRYSSVYSSVWRWRRASWNDFKARMDWCVASFKDANHHPHAVLNGDLSDAIMKISARAGETLEFDAQGSFDPDEDKLLFNWWIYPEAGKRPYGEGLPIENASDPSMRFSVPANANGKELHLILEVWDQSTIVPLVDYRRVVITVDEGTLRQN